MGPEITVRAIEYEVVRREEATGIGVNRDEVERNFGTVAQVAVVRCVDRYGQKLTALGSADHLRNLLDSGEARDPAGMKLTRSGFPMLIQGWLRAS